MAATKTKVTREDLYQVPEGGKVEIVLGEYNELCNQISRQPSL